MKKSKTNQIKDNFSDEFYQDMTRFELSSSYSVKAMFGLLIFILILVIGMLVVIYLTRNGSLDFLWQRDFPASNIVQPKVNIQNNPISVSISEEELSTTLKIEDPSFPLKDARLKILPEAIVISGKTGQNLFSPRISVKTRPEVSEGKIKFVLTSLEIGRFPLPSKLKDSLSQKLGEYLGVGDLNLPEGQIGAVSLSPGKLQVDYEKN